MPEKNGQLYVVATPIGNLGDISFRAKEVLETVDLVAAEDTRRSGQLLKHLGIKTSFIAYHDHNERNMAQKLLARLGQGESIALLSDAGTPLIRDPGFHLVKTAHLAGIKVVPIPGACAAIAALSVAGLSGEQFIFEGFLPATVSQRQQALKKLVEDPRTLIFYEAPHRVLETFADMVVVFGEHRHAVFAREITKIHEDICVGSLAELKARLEADPNRCRGEFVILLAGFDVRSEAQELDSEDLHVLTCLLEEMSVKQAAQLAAKITQKSKNAFYQKALQMKPEK